MLSPKVNTSLQHFLTARALLTNAHGTDRHVSLAQLDLQEAAVLLRVGDFSGAVSTLGRALAVFIEANDLAAAAMTVIRQAAVEEARGDPVAALALLVVLSHPKELLLLLVVVVSV